MTSYKHRLQVQEYDISALLQADNEISVIVAGGWAVGSFTYYRVNRITADKQFFLAQIDIQYADGTHDCLQTDSTWLVTEETPWTVAEWYDGEAYDANFDMEKVEFVPVATALLPVSPALLPQYAEPVRAVKKMQPVSVHKAPSGEYIYDFGQNFAGVISFTVSAKKGTQLRFRHAEVLTDGELFTKALRTAKAEILYTCKEGRQSYSPRFTYMGFRYVGVSGIEPENLELSAFALCSDMERIGQFSCSDDRLNRLHENIVWGAMSNFIDIPTDCPQRDERMGWTGDIALFSSTACKLFDMRKFLGKWLWDLRSEQGKGGGFPMVVPTQGAKMPIVATSCWGDRCILVPWAVYMASGDKTVLEDMYPSMLRFLKAARFWASFGSLTKDGKNIWMLPFHYGDWCAPGETTVQWLLKGKWIATAYYANSCFLVSKIAELLGKTDDAQKYKKQATAVCNAYRNRFTDGNGTLKKEFQTAYVLPLAFGMTQGEETAAMAKNLVRLIEKNGNCLQTGFPGTPYILFALADNGYADKAYELLLQEKCPSWLYEVNAGATTVWERWDALRPDGSVNTGERDNGNGGMVSFNHYAYGAVGDFLYRRVAGLEATSGGYKTFKAAPVPGGNLRFAQAQIKTPYGLAACRWTHNDGVFTMTVTVPGDTLCEAILPNGEKQTLQPGVHVLKCSFLK